MTHAIAGSPAASRHDQAERDRLERVWAKNPTSTVFARLADAYLEEGRHEEAAEICLRGLRYRPAYVAGHFILGRSLLAAGKEEAARDAFLKVLRLDRDHPAALGQLATLARTMGDAEMADSYLSQVAVVDPLEVDTSPVPRASDGERIGILEPSVEVGRPPDSQEPKPFATVTLARLYADQGHCQEALDLATWLARYDPDAEGVQELIFELEAAR